MQERYKEAIRIISNAGFRIHTAPLFAQLSILLLDQLIKLHILKFMHSFFHKTLPISFHKRWITNRERQPERILWNADLLFISQHNFATIKRMPMFNFPCIWNEEGAEKKQPKPVYLLAKCEKIAFSVLVIFTPLAAPPHPNPPAPHPLQHCLFIFMEQYCNFVTKD